MHLTDFTGSVWATAFQDTAEKILLTTSQEMGALKEQDSPDYIGVFEQAAFKEFMLKFRVNEDNYNVSF